MAEKQEENLLTIFKKIETELTKLRETMELQTAITFEAIAILPPIISRLQDEQQEMKKLFQWYAENQTGRKYT